jgi:hypothetical protein
MPPETLFAEKQKPAQWTSLLLMSGNYFLQKNKNQKSETSLLNMTNNKPLITRTSSSEKHKI